MRAAQRHLLGHVCVFAEEARDVGGAAAAARAVVELLHLLAHQRLQRRDHDRKAALGTVEHQRGQLVAQRLAAARRRDHKGVAPAAHRLHGVALEVAALERGVSEVDVQRRLELIAPRRRHTRRHQRRGVGPALVRRDGDGHGGGGDGGGRRRRVGARRDRPARPLLRAAAAAALAGGRRRPLARPRRRGRRRRRVVVEGRDGLTRLVLLQVLLVAVVVDGAEERRGARRRIRRQPLLDLPDRDVHLGHGKARAHNAASQGLPRCCSRGVRGGCV